MRKNFKKALAFACAMSMLLPAATPVSALAGNSASGTGSGIIENDNSVLAGLTRVTLPTVTNDTYDFSIDVEGLLKNFSNKYATTDNVYFTTIDTAASLAAAADGTKLYIVSKAEATAATVEGLLANKTVEEANTALAKYYVWQPAYSVGADGTTITRTGAGKFTTITTAFFDLTMDTSDATKIATATLKTYGNSGAIDTIFNGKIYEDDYTEVDTSNVANALALVKISDDATTLEGLVADPEKSLATSTDSGTTYTAVTADNYETALKYTAPTYKYTKTSAAAKVVNNSNFDIALTAKVTVSDNHGLTFAANSALAAATDNSINMAINLVTTGTAHSADIATASVDSVDVTSASASYVLKGVDSTKTTLYKGESTDINEATGSQNYYRYVNPGLTGSSVEFTISGAAAYTTDDAKAAWADYVEDLNADNATTKKPSITVVYFWEEVEVDANNATKYTSDAGSTYVITDATPASADYWCTTGTDIKVDIDASATADPGFTEDNYTYIAGTATEFILYPSSGTITAVAWATTSGSNAPNAMTSGTDYTISSNKVTLPAATGIFCTASTNKGTNGAGDATVYLYVTMDGTTYEVPVLIRAKTN